MLGYLEKGIQTPMAQGPSIKFISMIKWIRTSRLSMKNLSMKNDGLAVVVWREAPQVVACRVAASVFRKKKCVHVYLI